jgi:7-cyano-7-deazaguanine tRNA-ribosyltransferase
VAKSAKKIGEMPYQVHALGSPTEVMERYMFPVLVEMTMTAKKHLPPDRPLHLFGAGHPMMFAMAVAMGCDLFDSAAYALYAKDERYLTNRGTSQLKDLEYFPCSCPICKKNSAPEVKEMTKGERTRLLTEHNLHACLTEIDVIKQAIHAGNLWELMEARARSHPQMMSAFKTLSRYSDEFEKGTPEFKGKGVFYYDYNSLPRPQISRHIRRMKQNYSISSSHSKLILFTAPPIRPFTSYHPFQRLRKEISSIKKIDEVTICFVAAPYGIVPEHLAETYPLSQYEIAEPLDHQTIHYTVDTVVDYLQNTKFQSVILVSNDSILGRQLRESIKENIVNVQDVHGDPWSKETTQIIIQLLSE